MQRRSPLDVAVVVRYEAVPTLASIIGVVTAPETKLCVVLSITPLFAGTNFDVMTHPNRQVVRSIITSWSFYVLHNTVAS